MRQYALLSALLCVLITGCDIQEELGGEETQSTSNSTSQNADQAQNSNSEAVSDQEDDRFIFNPGEERCDTCDPNLLVAIAPRAYETQQLQTGINPFRQGDEELIIVPEFMRGAEFIQTDNVAINTSAVNTTIFSVLQNADAFVVIDSDVESADWLKGWDLTAYQVSTNYRAMAVYRKPVTAGHTVTVGEWPLLNSSPVNFFVSAIASAEIADDAVAEDAVESGSADQEVIGGDEDIVADDSDQGAAPNNPEESSGTDALNLMTPSNYEWSILAEGGSVYIDRTYTYRDVPDGMEGFVSLRTANSDKISTARAHIVFGLENASRVYVAIDERMEAAPSWLSTWQMTEHTLVTSDTTLEVYQRDFSPGTVVLGGNSGSFSVSNYVVFVSDTSDLSEGADPIDRQPVAANDFVSVQSGADVVISVLANDRDAVDLPVTVQLVSEPELGMIELIDNQFVYDSPNDYDGSQTFQYQVVDADGDRSVATVIVDVVCQTCSNKTLSVSLSWLESTGNPNSYEIFAANSDLALSRESVPFKIVPSAVQSVQILGEEVGDLAAGDRLCFKLRARNRAGVSDFSDTACVNI